jgi:membrane protease YdiL (CAAX protease family)
MKRLIQFGRSVIPADPWQLVFLTGAILLFVCPRMPWRPTTELLTSNVLPLAAKSDAVMTSVKLIVVLLYPATFAGLVAYFTCFYPGKKPIQRVLTLVFLPAIFGLGSILFVLSQMFRPPSSVFFQSQAYFPFAYRWIRSNVWDLPIGLWFCLFPLLLIAIFLVRLRSGKSSLPLALAQPSAQLDPTSGAWPRVQVLIFVLLGPLFGFGGIGSFALMLPYTVSRQSLPYFFLPVAIIVGPILDAGILVAIALWILGRDERKTSRSLIKLPEPRFAAFAFVLPIFVSGFLGLPGYVIDRANWAIYRFNQSFPPQIASYFDLSHLWRPSLLFMTFAAFAEEVVFRGILLQKLISRYGLQRGIFLTGLVWGAGHFRSDSYSGLSVGGVLLHMASRILICLAMNYVFAWMALQWKSVVPAGIAHTISNIIVVAGVNNGVSWSGELRIIVWAVIAFFLFRYWPLAGTEPTKEIPPTVPLESAA